MKKNNAWCIFYGQGTQVNWWDELKSFERMIETEETFNNLIEKCEKRLNLELQKYVKEGKRIELPFERYQVKEWLQSKPEFVDFSPLSFVMIGILHAIKLKMFYEEKKQRYSGVNDEIRGALGHSQGIFSSLILALTKSKEDFNNLLDDVLCILFWISVRTQQTFDQQNESKMKSTESTAMLSINGINQEQLKKALQSYPTIILSIQNSKEKFVLSGFPKILEEFKDEMQQKFDNLKFFFLNVSCAFHFPLLSESISKYLREDLSSLSILNRSNKEFQIDLMTGITRKNGEEYLIKNLVEDFLDKFVDWQSVSDQIEKGDVYFNFGPGLPSLEILSKARPLQFEYLKENSKKWLIQMEKLLCFFDDLTENAISSLQVTQLAQLTKKTLRIAVSPVDVFNNPSKEEFREFLISSNPYLNGSKKKKVKEKIERVDDRIAIIGFSEKFPSSLIKEEKREMNHVRRFGKYIIEHPFPGCFLNDIDMFDEKLFGIFPREAENMDPGQRILLEKVYEALENSGYSASSIPKTTGVFIGKTLSDYGTVIESHKDQVEISNYDKFTINTGNHTSVASGRISFVFGLNGPSITVDTACSSSLVALHLASQSILSGESPMAIAGAVNIVLNPLISERFLNVGMLSPDGKCKAFDSSANGYVRSEGCGVVVIKKLSQAIKDKDNIRAIIHGTSANHSGKSNGLTAPNGIAQRKAMKTALKNSGINSQQISFVEAHGTGTPLGDPIEMKSILEVYGKERTEENPLIIGSVKTNIGHCEVASGMAGKKNFFFFSK